MLISLESKEKYDSNSKFLENIFKEYLLNRNSPFGEIFKHIPEEDLIAIYKRAPNLYNYVANRDKFGGPNQMFEYYPDSSGKVLNYRNEIRSVESPGIGKGIPILLHFFEIIRLIGDNLAKALNEPKIRNRIGWEEKPFNQKLVKFEPKNDEDSYLIQSADVMSNFFLHLIRHLVGIRNRNSEKKAKILIDSGLFDDCLDKIKENFRIQNGACVCSNSNLKVGIILQSDTF